MDGNPIGYAEKAGDQIIQPYLDDDIFFSEQWIYATYSKNVFDVEPGCFTYFVKPPEKWTEVNKNRVEKHFLEFNIAKRYSTRAAEHLGIALGQVNNFRKVAGLDHDDFIRKFFQGSVDSVPFPNHWFKGMYQALIDSLK